MLTALNHDGHGVIHEGRFKYRTFDARLCPQELDRCADLYKVVVLISVLPTGHCVFDETLN
jgi:hypothetical protein